MGPVGVELGAPRIEADLLRGQVALRRTSGLRFQGPVHPLVGSVLLRLTGVDAVGELGDGVESVEVSGNEACALHGRVGGAEGHGVAARWGAV